MTTPLTARGRRTREALVQAARFVFERDGFFEARIGDIADEAGVAHGSFYTYFASKEEAFAAVLEQVAEEVFEASKATGAGDPWEAIDAANARYFDAYERNARILLLVDQLAPSKPQFRELQRSIRRVFVERAARGLKELQAAGLADGSLDVDHAASALAGMVEHGARVWIGWEEPHDRALAVATLTELWGQAIGLRRSRRRRTRRRG